MAVLAALSIPEGEVQVWQASHALRRTLRYILQGLKMVTEELDRRGDR